MRISTAGLALVKQSEGFRTAAYKDTAGLLTIGYGHRILPGESFPPELSRARAEALLLSDLAQVEQQVARLVQVPLSQGQFDALVDFVFNLGSGRLEESTLLKRLNAKQYAEAASELLKWDHDGTKVVPGLKTRREAELRLFTGAETAAA